MKKIILLSFFVTFAFESAWAQLAGCDCATTNRPETQKLAEFEELVWLKYDYWVTMNPAAPHNRKTECGKRCKLLAGSGVVKDTRTGLVKRAWNCGNDILSAEIASSKVASAEEVASSGSSATAAASVGDINITLVDSSTTIINVDGGQGGGNSYPPDYGGYPQETGSQFNLSIQSGGFGPALACFNQGIPMPPNVWAMLPLGPIPMGMPQGFGGYLQQQCPSCCSSDGGNTTIINNNTTIINNPPPVVGGDPDPEPDPEDDFGNGNDDGEGNNGNGGGFAEGDFRNKQEGLGESRGLTALATASRAATQTDRNAHVERANPVPVKQPSRNTPTEFRQPTNGRQPQVSHNTPVNFRERGNTSTDRTNQGSVVNQPIRAHAQPGRNASTEFHQPTNGRQPQVNHNTPVNFRERGNNTSTDRTNQGSVNQPSRAQAQPNRAQQQPRPQVQLQRGGNSQRSFATPTRNATPRRSNTSTRGGQQHRSFGH